MKVFCIPLKMGQSSEIYKNLYCSLRGSLSSILFHNIYRRWALQRAKVKLPLKVEFLILIIIPRMINHAKCTNLSALDYVLCVLNTIPIDDPTVLGRKGHFPASVFASEMKTKTGSSGNPIVFCQQSMPQNVNLVMIFRRLPLMDANSCHYFYSVNQ